MKFFDKHSMIWPEAHLPGPYLPRGKTSVLPVNSAGYRGREPLDRGDFNILFIGDEHTEGTNISYEHTFSYLVSKKISSLKQKRICEFNLGQKGKSYDYVSRILMCSLEIIRPNFVFICFPPMGRREYFALDGRLVNYDPETAGPILRGEMDTDSVEREIVKSLDLTLTKFDAVANALRNAILIKALLEKRSIDWAFGAIRPGNENISLLISRNWLSRDSYIGEFSCPPLADRLEEEVHDQFSTKICNWLLENIQTFEDEHG